MTKGWCPVHDRVVDSRNGVCPECGTPLVDLSAGPSDRDEEHLVVEEEAPEPGSVVETTGPAESTLWPEVRLPQRLFGRDTISIGPAAIAAILVAAVLASFLVGLAIPRGDENDREAKPGATARSDYRVGRESTGGGVRLRLERFTQRGRRLFLRVTVPDQPSIESGRIFSVTLAPEVLGGSVLDEVSMRARTTIFGFIAEGVALSRDDITVTGIRIVRIEMAAAGSGRAPLDLSRVWPLETKGPLANDRSVRLSFPGRSVFVTGLVGWPDRLEVQLEERGLHEGWIPADQYTLLTGGADAEGEVVREPGPTDPTRTLVVSFEACRDPAFRCVPRGLEHATLFVRSASLSIAGRWAWEFS